MAVPGKQLHLRLPEDLGRLLDETCAELPALSRGLILRGLLADQLRKPLAERVRIVTEQLKRKPESSLKRHRNTDSGINARNRSTSSKLLS